jgi:F-type H+-transporting ATPase subunit b
MITDTTLSPPDATLVVELAAFLVVLTVIAKFVVPRIRATIEQRQARIATALAAADDADRQRQAVEVECRELLAAARREARVITDGARAMKDHLIAEGRREGQAEYAWRSARIDRERRRDDTLIRRRLALEAANETELNPVLEFRKDQPDAARLTGTVGRP